jgi:ornithine cyclodeaminase
MVKRAKEHNTPVGAKPDHAAIAALVHSYGCQRMSHRFRPGRLVFGGSNAREPGRRTLRFGINCAPDGLRTAVPRRATIRPRVRILALADIRQRLEASAIVALMRNALIAQSRRECDTPMPMHLDIPAERAEVHIKASYRRGGRYFALKVASTFPRNSDRGLATGDGMMLLASAESGEPVVLLADRGHLTDVRTAAAAAMVARELHRHDRSLGIVGTGVQARLQAQMHAAILPLEEVWIWGRDRDRSEACRRDVAALLPAVEVKVAGSAARIAEHTRLIVTCTAARAPLLFATDIRPGTHISAVGSDGPGKQELDPAILCAARLLLADSRRQCQKLGELQHAPSEFERACEIGEYCADPVELAPDAISICDFTGLGVEDLYIAEYCYERSL